MEVWEVKLYFEYYSSGFFSTDCVEGSIMKFSSGVLSWYSEKLFFLTVSRNRDRTDLNIFTEIYLCDVMWLFFLSVSLFQAGFVGCVRDLKLNEVPSQSPSHSVGVTPCYQQPLQPGVYFSSQGGYLTIGEPSDRTLHFQSQRWWTIEYTLFIAPLSHARRIAGVRPGPRDPFGGPSGFGLWAPAAHWSQDNSTAESLSEPGPGDTHALTHIHAISSL